MNDLTGIWTSCFALLSRSSVVSLLWMHFAIRRMEQAAVGTLAPCRSCRSSRASRAGRHGRPGSAHRLAARGPEFWAEGKSIANRNL
ncbi:MAG: hypothetical protein R3D25_02265 [Geminicoccaceae bacterium]